MARKEFLIVERGNGDIYVISPAALGSPVRGGPQLRSGLHKFIDTEKTRTNTVRAAIFVSESEAFGRIACDSCHPKPPKGKRK